MQLMFLTGHDEFNYVKSALNVGAVGYLLKPLDLNEIGSVIAKVKQRCEEVQMKKRSMEAAKTNLLKELSYEKMRNMLLIWRPAIASLPVSLRGIATQWRCSVSIRLRQRGTAESGGL